MKNYYDELEVSQTASKEVIQKVYKILAKKYHPDTTLELNRHLAEEKFKKISEAYEVLSDDTKRQKYDLELKTSNKTVPYEDYLIVIRQKELLQQQLHLLKNKYNSSVNSNFETKTHNNINSKISYENIRYNNSNTDSSSKNFNTASSIFNYYKQRLKDFIFNVTLFFFSLFITAIILNVFLRFFN